MMDLSPVSLLFPTTTYCRPPSLSPSRFVPAPALLCRQLHALRKPPQARLEPFFVPNALPRRLSAYAPPEPFTPGIHPLLSQPESCGLVSPRGLFFPTLTLTRTLGFLCQQVAHRVRVVQVPGVGRWLVSNQTDTQALHRSPLSEFSLLWLFYTCDANHFLQISFENTWNVCSGKSKPTSRVLAQPSAATYSASATVSAPHFVRFRALFGVRPRCAWSAKNAPKARLLHRRFCPAASGERSGISNLRGQPRSAAAAGHSPPALTAAVPPSLASPSAGGNQ
uniref:Uncharacterized protein n=1 Tax=Mycena chlorophos TaxID=658473 RepID=A0ABQ0M7M4_MYCCL|nr:predicted protein [Mycena chlorophos]